MFVYVLVCACVCVRVCVPVCVCACTPHLLFKDTDLRALHWAGHHAYHGGGASIHVLLGQTNEEERHGGEFYSNVNGTMVTHKQPTPSAKTLV